jgi:diguanylate cyclase (GGDEF)-like protein/PAS domain S-box-containing protein
MMLGIRSARGRALVSGLVLLFLLMNVAILATWRAQRDRDQREALAQRTAIVAALENARAQLFRGATLVTAAVFSEDPIPLVTSYRQAQDAGDESLQQARSALIAVDETDEIGTLDSFTEQIGQLRQEVDAVLTVGVTADRSTRIELGSQFYPQMWPKIEDMMATLERVSGEQQARLADARAVADQASDSTLTLLIAYSTFAFLVGAATLIVLVVSIVRPLASLQESARAVASGDLDARAEMAGPEEVKSLARDFNEMIAERKRAEEALRESETRYRHIFESIQDIFYRTNAQGIILEISPSVQRVGYGREQLIGTNVLDVYENPEQRMELVKAILERGEVSDYEIRLRRGDGRVVDMSISGHALLDPDGAFIGTEGVLRDISERKQAEEVLREQARRDPLTGALNHGAIVKAMRGLISDDERVAPWAVAMIDVNRLKVTNDTYGHPVGDAVLVAVAAALSRDGALVGRYGGDEFVAILPAANRKAAERYRSEARDALASVAVTDPETGEGVPVEASIGLALYPEDARTLADLIKVSDREMYATKRQRPTRRAA